MNHYYEVPGGGPVALKCNVVDQNNAILVGVRSEPEEALGCLQLLLRARASGEDMPDNLTKKQARIIAACACAKLAETIKYSAILDAAEGN